MKKLLYFFAVIGISITLNSCKKTDGVNPLADIKNLTTGSYLTLGEATNLNLNYASIATSTVSIKVSQYLTPGQTTNGGGDVDKIKVYVVKGANADPTSWKLVKTVTYGGPNTVLSASGSEVATALGTTPSSLAPGGVYTFYNQILTKDGRTFDISNVNSALESNSNYNASFRWQAFVVCPFTGAMTGTYKVIRDDWADWNAGDLVQVKDGAANQIDLSLVWPNAAYGNVVKPLLVNIDPATGSAKVPKVNFGDYGGGYNMTAVGSNSGDVAGYVFSCTGYISLTMNLKADAPGGNGYNNGATTLILQKQ